MTQDDNTSNLMIKCIFIGNLSVGKTSIILRYSKNEFTSGYIPTIGADFTTTPLDFNDIEDINQDSALKSVLDDMNLSYERFQELNKQFSEESKIYIWDLAGQPLFQRIRTYYMSHAYMAIVVVDLSKPNTFDINSWISDIKKFSKNANIILVGNKMDLVNLNDSNLKKKIKSLENKYKVKFHYTSAKTGDGIKELFYKIKLHLMEVLEKELKKIGNNVSK